ncbi:uracil-DNA glycosylase [Rheinheimera sp.]|uniref:uracil-DNA glycosylase n=1 Tax=Rheinheimera sp. TaxID=1869214 RepID=UPI00307F873D
MSVSWQDVIGAEKNQPYFIDTINYLKQQRAAGQVIYPPESMVFNAFKYTPFDQLKVVIIGQDPYHGPNQAHGLSFSVPQGVAIPPSLRNIYKELQLEYEDFRYPDHGCLENWAQQGVLLLNTVLTVVANEANSHRQLGWEQFTDQVIRAISAQAQGIVFLLWGSHAIKKGQLVDKQKHHILTAPHPSPLSAHRGFLGCGHFVKANALLTEQGKAPICWQV